MKSLGARGLVRAPLVGASAPAALALAGCLLMRTEAASLLAPLLGPWAGAAYGHGECTLGNQAPLWSWMGVAALALAAAGAWLTRGTSSRSLRRAATVLLALAASNWFALAWLSVVNTMS
jgi:hypothetical protein